MPYLEVKIYESRLNADTETALIDKLTQAVVDVFDESVRENTWVVLSPVPVARWGIAGRQGPSTRPSTETPA